jgi:hypothetical protein
MAKIWNQGRNRKYNNAARDQAVSTNYLQNKIFKAEIDSKFWLCELHEKSTDHITSESPF